MIEICAPHRSRIRVQGEFAEVVERALEQPAHSRVVERHAALSQCNANLANLLIRVRAHCPKGEEFRLAREPVRLDVLARLGHVAATRERGMSMLRHGPLHRVVRGLKRLRKHDDQNHVGKAHKRIEVAAALIEIEAAARPQEPRLELIRVPDAGRRVIELAYVAGPETFCFRHGVIGLKEHLGLDS